MLHKLRQRAQDEKVFTLVGFLVRHPRRDRPARVPQPAREGAGPEAKTGARTAQTAMETLFTDNQTYAARRGTKLRSIEPL